MARRALAARPTIFGEDTLGWALHQAGRPGQALPHARAAVRLGTADGLLWYHLAAVEADLGLSAAARGHLAEALEITPYLTLRDLPAALALAERLRRPPRRTAAGESAILAPRRRPGRPWPSLLLVAGGGRAARPSAGQLHRQPLQRAPGPARPARPRPRRRHGRDPRLPGPPTIDGDGTTAR